MPEKRFSIRRFFRQPGNTLLAGLQPTCGFALTTQEMPPAAFQADVSLRSLSSAAGDPLPDSRIHDCVFEHHASGVEVQVEFIEHRDTATLEISGRIYNRSRKSIQHVHGPVSLCFTLAIGKNDTVRMTSVYGGGPTDGDYPPQAYKLTETDGVRFLFGGHEGGRSTETEMPYVIFTDETESSGLFCALEWPASWTIDVRNVVAGGKRMIPVVIKVGGCDLTLEPGESIPIPRAHIGFFVGDAVAGSNALRRHIVEHLRPPTLPPVFYNHYFGLPRDWTVEDQFREADIYAELGVEYYVVDAEWFAGKFRQGIGNWEVEDQQRFPNGMVEFAEHVRSRGMKFGSWLEIEWAMKGSHWALEHPDWFDALPGRYNTHYDGGEYNDLLLRLGDAEVRDRVADFLEAWVDKYGIEWLRWDMNNSPQPIWQATDPPGQRGWRQLEYAEGLYALLDAFMRRCPQVSIEACSSGGYRMDLGTLRRAHTAWMCDNTDTHDPIRLMQKGVNRVVPGCYANSTMLWATHDHRRTQSLAALKRDGYPTSPLRSRMGGSLGFAESARLYTPKIKEQLQREIVAYKAQRHLLLKDYYPLFAPQRLAEFDGWQFHDPLTGQGFVQIFRVNAPATRTTVNLPGLDVGTRYTLRDVDTNRKKAIIGGTALKVTIPDPQGTKWYQYGLD
jgi:hypothetical protein